MERDIDLSLNGARRTLRIEETTSLLDALRGPLGLSGPRYGCGAGECGSCAVLVDGEEKSSCTLEIGFVSGKHVTTVEGIGTPERPHPLQTAVLELQAGQCGYCLAGILIGAKALLDRNPKPTRTEIAKALAGHLCRCGVHNRVLDAVMCAAARMAAAS